MKIKIDKLYYNRAGIIVGPLVEARAGSSSEKGGCYFAFRYDAGNGGTITVSREGRAISPDIDHPSDLIAEVEVESEGNSLTIKCGRFYKSRSGKTVGPMIKNDHDHLYTFYYKGSKEGNLTFTKEGRYNLLKGDCWFDLIEEVPIPAHFVEPQQVEVKLPAPRRRMITINSVKNIVTDNSAPKWKRLSVYESKTLILPLSEIQHIEKRVGYLLIVTSKSSFDFSESEWKNSVYVYESQSKDFLEQFYAYITFRETQLAEDKYSKETGKPLGLDIYRDKRAASQQGGFNDESEIPF